MLPRLYPITLIMLWAVMAASSLAGPNDGPACAACAPSCERTIDTTKVYLVPEQCVTVKPTVDAHIATPPGGVINASSNIKVLATEHPEGDAQTRGVSVGLGALGGSVSNTTVAPNTTAYIATPIVHAGGSIWMIAGERGTLLRSTDNGEHWQKLAFPYAGSMFGILAWDEQHFLTYGLRGNIYESSDQGASWTKVVGSGSATLMGGVATANGGAVLAGANGTVLVRPAFGAVFAARTFKNTNGETPYLAGVTLNGNGDYLLVGDKGVDLYHPQ